MSQSASSYAAEVRRPMIAEEEVDALAHCYGTPVRRTHAMIADEYIRYYRFRPDNDRRAEVVFAIQNPADQIWLHTKSNYPSNIYRLMSGGIQWDETVLDALWREVDEETGLPCVIERFLGVLTYHFHHRQETASFASYVFSLRADFSQPVCQRDNEISAYRAVLPSQLLDVSVELRNLIGNRHGWGQWRALAVELVHEQLTKSSLTVGDA